jgi:hypothetical protein
MAEEKELTQPLTREPPTEPVGAAEFPRVLRLLVATGMTADAEWTPEARELLPYAPHRRWW